MLTEEDTTKIKSKKDFKIFLEKLYDDYLNNSKTWESATLEDFLKSLISYTEDIDGYFTSKDQSIEPELPSWSLFADILAGARIYE